MQINACELYSFIILYAFILDFALFLQTFFSSVAY